MTLFYGDTIADAVVTLLNSSGGPCYGQKQAVRTHAIKANLEDTARIDEADEEQPVVSVFVKGYQRTQSGRNSFQHTYRIGVCVQCYCTFTNTSRVAELTRFTETVVDRLTTNRVVATAAFMGVDHEPLFYDQMLDSANQFLSVPIITYRIERSA